MQNKKWRLYSQIGITVLVIIGCIFAIRRQKQRDVDLAAGFRYTIGTTDGWSRNYRSSQYKLNYSYFVKSSLFTGYADLDNLSGVNKKGGKYIVMYERDNPNNSKLLLDREIEYNGGAISDTGWKEIPSEIKYYKNGSK